jgi:threonine synthase
MFVMEIIMESTFTYLTGHFLTDIVVQAYGNHFTCPITKLTENLNILELFHGKTKAFKDIPLMLVSQFLDFFLGRQRKHLTLLVVTSGDTGSAAIESVRGCRWIDIIVLFPKGYCNSIQERQMTTVQDDNVHVFAVEGTTDDVDVPMKACLVDSEFAAKYKLGSVNSINVVRLISQVVFYFYAYFKVCEEIGESVKFVVPTGAMSNVTGINNSHVHLYGRSYVSRVVCWFSPLLRGVFSGFYGFSSLRKNQHF